MSMMNWLRRLREKVAIERRHLRALAGRYFWLPCPLCGEYFGGNEWEHDASMYLGDGSGCGVCAKCGPRARTLSEADAGAIHATRCEH